MRVLILGGAGLMAEATERDLLEFEHDGVSQISVADVTQEGIARRLSSLNSPKVKGILLDASDNSSLVSLIRQHDIVVHAAPAHTTHEAVKLCLEAQVSIVTLLGLGITAAAPDAPHDEFGQTDETYLLQLDAWFKEAGIIGLMGMGSMPGTSNVLGSYLGDSLDTVQSMEFSYVYAHLGKQKTFFPFNPFDIIGQYSQPALVLRDGRPVWLPPRSGRQVVGYPEPIGAVETFYINHTEVTDFARRYRDKGLLRAGTKTGWSRDFIAKLDFLDSLGLLDLEPTQIGGTDIRPAEVLAAQASVALPMIEGTRDYGCTRLEIEGTKDGQRVLHIAHVVSAPYKDMGVTQHRTGIPPSVAVGMIRTGKITRKGCYSADYGVDPKTYFRELEKRSFSVWYGSTYRI